MSRRADIIVTAFVALGIILAVLCAVMAFMGDYVWMTCAGMLSCYCALMCVFVTVYVWR